MTVAPLLRILTAQGYPAQTLGTSGVRERLVLSWGLAEQSQGRGGTLSLLARPGTWAQRP